MKSVAPAFAVTVAFAMIATGCSTKHYRTSADKESYRAIQQKSGQVQNMDRQFTIEQTNLLSLENLPLATNAPEALGQYALRERTAQVLSLEQALEIAVRHNRAYQARKEQLYLSALGLTLDRHRFTPIFIAGGATVIGAAREKFSTIVYTSGGKTN